MAARCGQLRNKVKLDRTEMSTLRWRCGFELKEGKEMQRSKRIVRTGTGQFGYQR